MTPDELRSTRRALKLTQAELAAELGVTMGTVYEMEKGLRPIRRMVELAMQTLERQSSSAATGQTSNRPITPAKNPAEISRTHSTDKTATKPVQNPTQTNPTVPPIRYI